MKLLYPPLGYDCLRCGKSCGGWRVLADEPARERLAHHPLTRELGFVPFVEDPDGLFRMAEDAGRCVYQAGDGLCRLHSASGPEVKPRACRQFPFFLVETPDGVVVGLSFRCTAVQQHHGRPTSEHEELLHWLVSTGSYPRRGFGSFPLAHDRCIAWPAYRELEALAFRCLEARPLGEGLWSLVAAVAETGPRSPETERLSGELVAALAGYLEARTPREAGETASRMAAGLPFFSQRLNRLVDPGRLSAAPEWLEAELARYLEHLIFRKFLLEPPSILGRAVGLMVIAPLVRFYTVLAAEGREPSREDLGWALDVVEGEVVAHTEGMELFYRDFEKAFTSVESR